MTNVKPERWQQVEQLYHAAREHNVEERAKFLAEACRGDEGLRLEVESLLAYDDPAVEFIESPALEVAAKLMAQEQDTRVLAGQTINHYRIIAPIGAGGMGEVFLADDTRLARKVALKFLPLHLTQDKSHLGRFEQEARAIAALPHPGVCTVHEVIKTEDGRHCIVMEYVDGQTLRHRLATGKLKLDEALDVAMQIASALSAAHIAGIVHRDIKPENIILRRDGYAKILDFGLAKLTEPQAEDAEAETRRLINTSPGMIMGTASYMSPEQARGLQVDERTDLWSLGVLLYEMVSGQQPFTGPTLTDVIVAIVEREPVPLTEHSAEVPAQLERIVRKVLAKDRDQRYQTAKDLLIDLKSLRHDLAVKDEVERQKQATPDLLPAIPASKSSRSLFHGLDKNRHLVLTGLAGTLVIVVGLAAWFLLGQRTVILSPTEIRSLAVLPLENLSGDANQDYFADGMTDALITDLAKVSALRVISRTSVMQYKGTRKPLPEIGRELNVDAVLTGSVVRSGDRIRLAVQLINAAIDRNMWADSYERDLRDVLALQRELTQDIVGQIRIQITPQDKSLFGNVNQIDPEAYDHYLRGQFYLHRQNREDNEAAITALERAVTKEPGFAAAHAELAQAYSWKHFLFVPDDGQLAEKAFVAAEKALSLDSNLAVAYLARGRTLWTPANRFPHEKAILEYRRALALNPSLDEARNQLALVYSHVGAFEEALQESRQAITINPNNNLAQLRIGQTLNFQGKFEEALVALRAIPQEVNPAIVGYQTAWALFNLGQTQEAVTQLEQLLRAYPEDSGGLFTSMQAVMAAASRQNREAEEKINLAVKRGQGFGHFHHTAYHIACAYAWMNKPEQAMKWLETAADDGFPCYGLFEQDRNLDNLRQDGRFVRFLAKQRKQWEHYRTLL